MGNIADKDYYRDAEGNLVEESDESAAFLVIRAGQEIPKGMADKYGIGKVAQTEEAEEESVEKSVKPSANKSARPTQDKGAK